MNDEQSSKSADIPAKIEPKARPVNIDNATHLKDDLDVLALPSAPGLSPSKPNGILMTPGTTRRNKSVSFGAQVVDNEGKKQGRSGLPNSYPGKFPSPWTPKDPEDLGTSNRARTKLTAQLQEIRDSAQKEKSDRVIRSKDDTDLTMDYMEPRSQSGKYWKREYQSYAENTQREMKKLVIKQKAAKDYAKEKEEEVADLQAQLRQERLKVESLEAKTKELAARMKDFEKKLLNRTSQEDVQDDISRPRTETQQSRRDLDQFPGKKSGIESSPKRKTPKAAPAGDLWADAVFSSPFVHDIAERDHSPLRTRDTNIQSQTPKSGKQIKATHTKQSSLGEDTMDMSLSLPQPSPEPLAQATPRSIRKSTADITIDELVEKYSPEKPRFDRLALPLNIGALNIKSVTPKQQGASPKKYANPPVVGQLPAGSSSVTAAGEQNKPARRITGLSNERIAKARARLEARKQETLAAV